MEELFTLKSLLLNGDISGALAVVEELEEMSRDDKINNIRRFAIDEASLEVAEGG